MKIIPTVSLTSLLLLLCFSISAQTMALVNGVATKVKYQDGELLEIYDTYPNYMNGFELPSEDNFTKVPPRLLQLEQPVAEEALAEADIMKKTEEYKVNNALFYDESSNTLDAESVIRVAGYANNYKSKTTKSFLLKGWYNNTDDESQKRIKQRLDEGKKALEKQGVPSNLILTSLIGASKESRFVTVITN